jgi:hypothetical protein
VTGPCNKGAARLGPLSRGIALFIVTLIEIAALPGRRDAIAELGRRAELAIGFRQLASVRRAAEGTTPWHDHAAAPHIGDHETQGGGFQPGLAGMMAAGVMSGGPPVGPGGFAGGAGPGAAFGFGEGYGTFGGYWAYRALGAGLNSAQQRPMAARPDVTRRRLTPATEDLPALTATGEDPTVLAFCLGSRGGRVAYEVLNLPEPMTFVYRSDGPGGIGAVNRALDDVGFRAAAVHASGLGEPSRAGAGQAELASAFIDRVAHDARWQDRIGELLGG